MAHTPPPPHTGTHGAVPAWRPPCPSRSIPRRRTIVPRALPSTLPRLLPVRLLALAGLLCGLLAALPAPVAAAGPTVTASPANVPFDPPPASPAPPPSLSMPAARAGATACGQDNGNLPTFPLGPVDANTPLTVNFPFIQAGKYISGSAPPPTAPAPSRAPPPSRASARPARRGSMTSCSNPVISPSACRPRARPATSPPRMS